MAISSGNLDSLVGLTLPSSDVTGIVVQSYEADTSNLENPTLTSVTGTETGAPSLANTADTSINIISVDDATSTISYNVLIDGAPFETLSDLVVGFSADAILLADAPTSGVAYEEVASSVGTSSELLGALSFAPIVTGETVTFTSSGVTDAPPCCGKGTQILTDRGEVAVENLIVGTQVRVERGMYRPVVWLGRRRVNCDFMARPTSARPIRIVAGAFGNGLPHRDLVLSPDHAVFVDAVLIPIKHLVNGISIQQLPISEVEYWHIELDSHDVVLAEGLPAESYLDTGTRWRFNNPSETDVLDADFCHWLRDVEGYAPLVVTGPVLEAVRARLNSYAPTVVAKNGTNARAHLAA